MRSLVSSLALLAALAVVGAGAWSQTVQALPAGFDQIVKTGEVPPMSGPVGSQQPAPTPTVTISPPSPGSGGLADSGEGLGWLVPVALGALVLAPGAVLLARRRF